MKSETRQRICTQYSVDCVYLLALGLACGSGNRDQTIVDQISSCSSTLEIFLLQCKPSSGTLVNVKLTIVKQTAQTGFSTIKFKSDVSLTFMNGIAIKLFTVYVVYRYLSRFDSSSYNFET